MAVTWGQAARERDSSLFVGSFEKGLRVLAAFGRDRPRMGLRELAAATGLDQSSVQRFAFTLHALGFLHKDEATRKYSLTAQVLELGFAYLQSNGLVEAATPVLYELNQACGETVNLTELAGTEVVYVARVPSRHMVAVDILLGTRMPAYATAGGRAMLAFMDRAAAVAVLEASDVRRLTPRTQTGLSTLLAVLDQVRRDGFAVTEEQCVLGEIAAAVPVPGPGGVPVGALNVAVPLARWTAEGVRTDLVPLLRQAAAQVARTAGAGAPPWFTPTIDGGRRAAKTAAA